MTRSTLAILEDSPQALAVMQQSIEQDNQATWQLLHTSTTSADMMTWLLNNQPDILVADLGLPDVSGIEVIKLCKSLHPQTEIIVCTVFEDDAHLFDSLQAGANAYLLKKDIDKHFANSLQQLLEHGAPMSPSIARRIIQNLNVSRSIVHALAGKSDGHQRTLDRSVSLATEHNGEYSGEKILTKKEIEILDLIARGFKNLEISAIQNVSIHTVQSHIKLIYKKLQVSSKNEAVFEARSLNILH